MISAATQIAALQTAFDIAHGRKRLTRAELELFERHIQDIRERIERAEMREPTRQGVTAIVESLLKVCPGGAVKDQAIVWLDEAKRAASGKDAGE